MGKGYNPKCLDNLINNSDLTPEQRREKASKMGKASVEAKRVLKTFKELDLEHTTSEQRLHMLEVIMKKASAGNIKAFEVYRDTVGLKPIEKIQVAEVDAGTIQEIEDAFNG